MFSANLVLQQFPIARIFFISSERQQTHQYLSFFCQLKGPNMYKVWNVLYSMLTAQFCVGKPKLMNKLLAVNSHKSAHTHSCFMQDWNISLLLSWWHRGKNWKMKLFYQLIGYFELMESLYTACWISWAHLFFYTYICIYKYIIPVSFLPSFLVILYMHLEKC